MQLALAQLGAHLQKGLRSLYTLYGDEPLLVQEGGDHALSNFAEYLDRIDEFLALA